MSGPRSCEDRARWDTRPPPSLPAVKTMDWTLMDVNHEDTNDKGHVATSLMNDDGASREDLFIPTDGEYARMIEEFEGGEGEVRVTVLSAGGFGADVEVVLPGHTVAQEA